MSFGEHAVPIQQVLKAECGQDLVQPWACICVALLAALTRPLSLREEGEERRRTVCVWRGKRK